MVVDELYYGKGRRGHTAPHTASWRAAGESVGIGIDEDVLAEVFKEIYASQGGRADAVEPHLFRALAATLTDAVAKGAAPTLGSDPFLDALRHSADVFAAFKTHRAQTDMAARLLDSNGNLKPFEQWRKEVEPIASHQCGAWLETEYNTAVLRARQAAQWQQFEREKDILPNLRWVPSTSPHPGKDHQPFWDTILPVDHPFWSRHRPGDRWNCKCDLSSTDEPATAVPEEAPGNDPQPGLRDNPGRSGAVISDDHPYFPKDCHSCPFYKPGLKARLKAVFRAQKKDCEDCPYVDGAIERAREAAGADEPRHTQPSEADSKIEKISREEVRDYFKKLLNGESRGVPVEDGPLDNITLTYQGIKSITGKPHKYAIQRNNLCYDIYNAMQTALYLGSSGDIKGPGTPGHGEGKYIWHYFKVIINKEASFVIVRADGANAVFHAIQDADHFKIEKIQKPWRKQ